MKRRVFLGSGSAAFAFALTACGGGGGGGADSSTAELPGTSAEGIGQVAGGEKAAASAAAPVPQPANSAPATPRPASGIAYPFAARVDRYVAGIQPTRGASAMDAVLRSQYDAWKTARVTSVDWVAPGGFAVRFSDSSTMAVSEGMGYGMLLSVLFAGHDPQAQAQFDGLLAVVRARPAWAVTAEDPSGKHLMEWRLNANGSSGGEGWNAMDGDLDIAMALLMADRQWGSAGSWNYLQEAKNTIDALRSWNMKSNGTTKGLPNENNNRTSDYMIGHFRAFQAATGDQLWDRAVHKAFKLLDRMQTVYSPGVGLVPDFIINTADDSSAAPSTGYIGDGNDKEGHFWWNACRNPLRLAADYVLSGDARSAVVAGRMIDFFQASSGGDPLNIGTGYALDGTKLTEGNSPAYHGPICAGACVDRRFQGFLDTMWDWNAGNLTTGYYDGEIQLLSLVVASGNWWSPAKA
jgi:hypothetical protein